LNANSFRVFQFIQGIEILYARGILIIAVLYGLYPLRFRLEKYFSKGHERIVVEYQFVKNLLYIWIPIIIVLLVIILALSPNIVENKVSDFYEVGPFQISKIQIYLIFNISQSVLAFFIGGFYGGIIRISIQLIKREFRFYFAKTCFTIVSKHEGNSRKIRYFTLGLNSYNKYLRRHLHFEIKDIQKIYSKFIYADTKNKDEIVKSLCESMEADRLQVARYLSALAEVSATELFVNESSVEKLKSIGAFVAVVIPIIISIIEIVRGK
jgi:hypothetical protein